MMRIYKNHFRPFFYQAISMLMVGSLLCLSQFSYSQANVSVRIVSGTSTTTCDDPIFGGAPEPHWGVNVESEGWVTYPIHDGCFNSTPNQQFSTQYDCPKDAGTLTICFEAFEDDGAGCIENRSCRENICADFNIPQPGNTTSHTLGLPAGLDSGGSVNFEITTTGSYVNGTHDDLCGALELGTLSAGGKIGDATLSTYDNYCTDGFNEPNPGDSGAGWANNFSVWFSFSTAANPSALINILATSDPENTGEPMGIQMALYESLDGTCNDVEMVASRWNNMDLDELLLAKCLKPNTKYYIIIDGIFPPNTNIFEGRFGLEIRDESIEVTPDFLCDAEALGAVPEGGLINTGMDQSNICSTGGGDPPGAGFGLGTSVWYSFIAPDSRHVNIEAISSASIADGGLDPLDIQLAVFESSDNTCTGDFSVVGSSNTPVVFDETLELSCLEPGREYFLVVDGGPGDFRGIFDLTISDAGYDPLIGAQVMETLCFGGSITIGATTYNSTGPVSENFVTADGCDSLVTGFISIRPEVITNQSEFACAGGSITVGTSIYNTSGGYIDVLTDINGCDSTVNTTFFVAAEMMVDADQLTEATGYQIPDGSATAVTIGGLPGGYTYLWSDGQSSQVAINLLGGTTYCVTVSDAIGCTAESCELILFPSNIIADIDDYYLTCPGDENGLLSLSISNGAIPYDYQWSNADNSLTGSGTIATEGGSDQIDNLPAGNYSFTITDAFGVKVVDGNVIDPPAIMTTLNRTLCFGESLIVGTAIYNSTGLINEVLTATNGCDSTVNGVINILPINETTLNETLCFGETLTVGSAVYAASGSINETLLAFNGCDSIVNGTLTIAPQIVNNINETICFGESLTVGGNIYSTTGSINETVPAIDGCDSLITGNLIVLPFIETNQTFNLCFGESVTVGTSVYSTNGTYMDVLQSANNCDSTVNTILNVTPELLATTLITSEATAYLAADGLASVSPIGGDGSYTYEWSTGADTPLAGNLQGGMTYCVTVTDGNDCTAEDCILVLFPSNIQTTLEDYVLNCPDDADGSLTLSVFNGVIPYDYLWEGNGQNGSGTISTEGGTASLNNLEAGTYSFTITDAFGVTNATAEVIEPDDIFTPLNETICFGESLTVGSNTYSATGLINEVLTSSLGCDSTVVGLLTILPAIQSTVNETLCFGESLIVGTVVYSTSGPITETLTSFNGCDSLVVGNLTILPQIATNQTETICFGEFFNVGTSMYNVSGNFEDQLTAFDGCDSTVYTNLTVLNELAVQAVEVAQASGLGSTDGVAIANIGGGSGSFSYEWSDGQTTPMADNLIGGENYCVTVTDDVGCTEESCVLVLFPVNIITNIENDTLDCVGDNNGSLNFTVSNGQAPYNYNWQNNSNALNGTGIINTEGGTATIGGLISDDYTITVTDAWGETILNASVVTPIPLTASIENVDATSCFGTCDALAVLNVAGGKSPYQFSWPDGQSSEAVVDLCAGSHEVTITDANNCSTMIEVFADQPTEFIATAIEVEPVTCFGNNNGQASVNTNGNATQYLWDNGETTATATNLSAGDHTVTITNSDNCTDIANVLITQPLNGLTVGIDLVSELSCADAADGMLTAVISGGSGNPSYTWSNGDRDELAEDLAPGTYFLTITDINGCTTETSYDLTAPSEINLTVSTVDITCLAGDDSGMVKIESVTGGVGPYVYSMDGDFFMQDSTFGGISAGDYDVYVQDAVGCVKAFPVKIFNPEFALVDVGPDEAILLGEEIELDAFSTSQDAIFVWSSMNEVEELLCDDCSALKVQPTETTIYTVGIVDTVTQCTSTDQIKIEVIKERNVYIPNAFSPNADGVNDYLTVNVGIAVEKINIFRVFNRWGALIYERPQGALEGDIMEGWNGKFRGKPVNAGVYVYLVEVEFKDGAKVKYTGDVTLFE